MKRILLLLSISLIVWASCKKKAPIFPIEPQIYYNSITPTLIDFFKDTGAVIKISVRFNDGDGDIGQDASEMTNSIYLKDSRDTTSADTTFGYPFPYISKAQRPDNGSLEGNFEVDLKMTTYIPTYVDSLHLALGADTVIYKIYIKDVAGHKSNVITTDPIIVKFK